MAFQWWAQRGERQRSSFICLRNAYHGDTIGSVSVGGIDLFHSLYRPLLFDALQAEPGDAAQLEALLREHGGSVAAVIVEPLVQGAAGMLVQPPGYLRRVRELCDEHGVFLICDEVATGFGRTGTMFACEQEDVSPDFLCLAKGLTGGYLPLAATLTTERVYEGFLGEFEELKTFFHGHTYTGNPLACAAGLATLEIFEQERTLDRLQPKIALLHELLDELVEPLAAVAEVRRCGFMTGIEMRESPLEARMGHQVTLAARRRGAIIRPLGDVVVLMPPLSIVRGRAAPADRRSRSRRRRRAAIAARLTAAVRKFWGVIGGWLVVGTDVPEARRRWAAGLRRQASGTKSSVILAGAADRAEPVARDVLERGARRDAAVGVALRRVVDEPAGLADPLLCGLDAHAARSLASLTGDGDSARTGWRCDHGRRPPGARRGAQPRARDRAAAGGVGDPPARRRGSARGAARQAQPGRALHGRRVGLPRRRSRRTRGRGRRGPPRRRGARARRGGRDRAARPGGAGSILALDHAGGGQDPLRHPLLPRPRARRGRAARRRRGVRRRRLVRAPGRARRAPQRRDPARLPDDQALRAARRLRHGRRAARVRRRPAARSCRSSRASWSPGETARVVLPGEPGYDDCVSAVVSRRSSVQQ